MLDAYFEAHDLPRHPLEAEGYPSIGCSPCTSKVKPGEDPRSGRWRGWDKTECGIHSEVTPIDDDPANDPRSEEHTSELQSLMRISYAVSCLKKQNYTIQD